MKIIYYSQKELQKLDNHMLSFGICNNLLDSAFYILQHPFELLREESKGYGRRKDIEGFELIASFLSTVTAIELLLKAMVALKNWKHLFSNENKVSRETLIKGEFKSINLGNCIAVIESMHRVKIDNQIKQQVELIRVIRNKITHFYLDFTKDEILEYISFGLNVFIEIYRSYLKKEVYDDQDRTEGFEEELADVHPFVVARIESSKIREGKVYHLDKDLYDECQRCWVSNLVLTKTNKIKCLYCGNEIDVEEYAKSQADDHTKITTCNKCKKKTVIIKNAHKPKCILCDS